MTGVLTGQTRRNRVLVAIKVVRTVVWAFFVGCIWAIPRMGWLGRFRAAWMLSVIVLGECLALAANRGRCPLTLTSERHQGFDIYLPGWVARWNKVLFGSVFVAGMLFVLWRGFG